MKLAIRSTRDGYMALCDADTGEILPGQVELRVITKVDDITKAVVTFQVWREHVARGGPVLQLDQVIG